MTVCQRRMSGRPTSSTTCGSSVLVSSGPTLKYGLTDTKKSQSANLTSMFICPSEWAPSTRLNIPYRRQRRTMSCQGNTILHHQVSPRKGRSRRIRRDGIDNHHPDPLFRMLPCSLGFPGIRRDRLDVVPLNDLVRLSQDLRVRARELDVDDL